ncbi:rhodanese-like domain-containing protein [Francisella frigiditurris]|uniref:Rhodanese-like domain protein n=1 Tax=Francisella frigiditurris TaxID=1542390 RepID=A0A1J0KUL9_9GAMM|nr:rhodanese-like domain-containing protein [Francisella frigiditurris]APC97441.1 rhodanese-like domain protein [Francisella frigiditurris]
MENLSYFVSQNLVFCLSFILLLAIYIVFELTQSKQSQTSLTVQNAVAEVNRHKGIYLDIRDQEEYKKAHVIGAINIPSEKIEENLKKLHKHKDKPVVIYGNSHSDKTRNILRKDGFEKAYSLKGGFSAWLQAGYPVKSEDSNK